MKRIIIGLLCLNFALVIYLGYASLSRPAAAPTVLSTSSEPRPKPISLHATKAKTQPRKRSDPRRFDWQALVSDDLKQYIANLRAVQCPEETIRDIILAEVNRRYNPLEQALKVHPEDRQPWETVAAYEKRSNESKLRQLLVEKRDLVKGLVGVDVPIETPPTLAGRNIEKFEAAYNDLPESKRDQVRATQEKYWSQSDDIKRRTMGFLEPEDREEYRQIKSERHEEMAKVLTPQELEDYELKTSATATAMRSRMSGFNATDEEFREIFRLTQPLDEQYSLITGTRDPEDKVAAAKRKEVEQQLQEQVRATLGDERYAEMERARDPNFQNLTRAAEQAGVPKESAIQAYEAQKLMRDEFAKVFGDPNLSPEQRQQAVAAMQAQSEKTLQTILGQQAFEALRRTDPNAVLPGGQGLQKRIQNIIVRPPAAP